MKTIVSLIILIFIGGNLYAQDTEVKEFKGTSIRTGIGVGFNEGHKEGGAGIVYSVGWQKNYGRKHKIRLNPNILLGEFSTYTIDDARDQYYKITSWGLNVHYDLIKSRAISIVTTVGVFTNYSRGYINSGLSNPKDYFHKLYFGGSASFGLRVNPRNSRIAYEFRPLSLQVGNAEFALGYIMLGIDFKLKK